MGETVTDTLARRGAHAAEIGGTFRARSGGCSGAVLEKDPQKTAARYRRCDGPAGRGSACFFCPGECGSPAGEIRNARGGSQQATALLAAGALAFIHFRETPPVAETVRFRAAFAGQHQFHTFRNLRPCLRTGRKLAFSRLGLRRHSASVDPIAGFAGRAAPVRVGNDSCVGSAELVSRQAAMSCSRETTENSRRWTSAAVQLCPCSMHLRRSPAGRGTEMV